MTRSMRGASGFALGLAVLAGLCGCAPTPAPAPTSPAVAASTPSQAEAGSVSTTPTAAESPTAASTAPSTAAGTAESSTAPASEPITPENLSPLCVAFIRGNLVSQSEGAAFAPASEAESWVRPDGYVAAFATAAEPNGEPFSISCLATGTVDHPVWASAGTLVYHNEDEMRQLLETIPTGDVS